DRMMPFRPRSTSEQLAEHLRGEILSGRLSGAMPGINQLVQTLGVNSVATTLALQQLEREGLLIAQGRRRKRLIRPIGRPVNNSLRLGFLHYDAHNELRFDSLLVRQALIDAGHNPVMAPKTMFDLGMSPERIARHVKTIEVDAWIVYAGSADTLGWFARYEVPTFAIYGRFNTVSLPAMGIRKTHVNEMLIKRLVDLGHRRIIWLAREERRKPHYGRAERFFLEQLELNRIKTGSYNIPDWEESPAGLADCLDRLLKHTPPTAIIVCDPVLFHAVQVHLNHRGFNAPRDVSLYCDDYAESFDWATPSVAHLRWDHRPITRRVLQWTRNLLEGREDRKQSFAQATFVDGDTIGPPPR
ncbi:MAG TPA: substrate-binding domain-containing protein, partial [Luteolibacter sp.]|nr:substrate-binding domain-containing protein [Luteolibacter sp.]